jgi:hypothetical protein
MPLIRNSDIFVRFQAAMYLKIPARPHRLASVYNNITFPGSNKASTGAAVSDFFN